MSELKEHCIHDLPEVTISIYFAHVWAVINLNFLYKKEQTVNILGFAGHGISFELLSSTFAVKQQPQTINKWINIAMFQWEFIGTKILNFI